MTNSKGNLQTAESSTHSLANNFPNLMFGKTAKEELLNVNNNDNSPNSSKSSSSSQNSSPDHQESNTSFAHHSDCTD